MSRSWKSKLGSQRSSSQWIGESVILVQILVLKGHVSIFDRDGELPLAE